MSGLILVVFLFVYIGMMLGEIPRLALDRSGIVLLGAITLLAFECLTPADAWHSIDVPTIALLFALMVISAQFRLGGFYTMVARRVALAPGGPPRLLALIIVVSAVLSALLANDIVCLAMAPVLIEGCARRRLNPIPFLLGLACASNIGSAATLIGNPQNMLIGQVLKMPFGGYLAQAIVPSALGLAITWWVLRRAYRSAWNLEFSIPPIAAPDFNPWQTLKGLVILALVVAAFLFAPWPREVVALAAAGVLLMSRRLASRQFFGLVDWPLLVLFMGLFVINHAMRQSGMLEHALAYMRSLGADMNHPAWLFGSTVVLSNLVSNVPAVMLLLGATNHPLAGTLLALVSTFAGNLIVVGSIANIIVIEQARALGVEISWTEHARIGIPVTLATLALAALWLLLLAA